VRMFSWLRKFGIGGKLAAAKVFETRCAICKRIGARIEIRSGEVVQKLIYEGIMAGTGPSGIPISSSRVLAIEVAFKTPYQTAKIRAAGFFDDAGFCGECEAFYCFTHWNPSTTGGGWCPNGHLKILDPHWSPKED
jgi:hypothetical protein